MASSSTQTDPIIQPAAPSQAIALAAVAAETTWIEEAAPFQCSTEVALSTALFQADTNRALHAATATAIVRQFTLEDVVLDADSGLLFKDGLLIHESEALAPRRADRSGAGADLPPPGGDIDTILGYNAAHAGYVQWVTQCLPAIDWGLRLQGNRPSRLLLPALSPWQDEFLRLLGFAGVPRLVAATGARYRLSRLKFAEFLTGAHGGTVSLSLRRTIERILSAAAPPGQSADSMLYVPGTDEHCGAPGNEADAIQFFRSQGIRIVEPGTSLNERINLFRGAHVVIGPTGPGLTDVVFCRPRTLLWEWMPRHYQNPVFNRLVQAAGMDYLGDVFPVVPPPQAGPAWSVEPEAVQQRLGQIRERLVRMASSSAPAPPERLPLQAPPALQPIQPPPQPAPRPEPPPPDAGARPATPEAALFRQFESLGDGAEFGIVQHDSKVDEFSLLRLARFDVPPPERLEKLTAALAHGFEGLGVPGTVTVSAEAVPGGHEIVLRDVKYALRYATGIAEDAEDSNVVAEREGKRLGLLGLKLLDRLLSGERICVWQSAEETDPAQLAPLLVMLRRLGRNMLLWVSPSDPEHRAGSIEVLESDLVRGYVRRRAGEAGEASGIDFESWLAVCRQTSDLRQPRPAASRIAKPTAAAAPAREAPVEVGEVFEPMLPAGADTSVGSEPAREADAATDDGLEKAAEAPLTEVSGAGDTEIPRVPEPVAGASGHSAMDYLSGIASRPPTAPSRPLAQNTRSGKRSVWSRLFGWAAD